MKSPAHIAQTAASYGWYATEARHHARKGDRETARFYAKHARSDWRALAAATGLPEPKAHPTADRFVD